MYLTVEKKNTELLEIEKRITQTNEILEAQQAKLAEYQSSNAAEDLKIAIEWAKKCQELGAGVLLPTSMDGDGTQAGYDLDFTKAISDAVDLPVVASGGAGNLEHFYEAVVKGGAQILLAASVFHYRILSIREVKEYLKNKGLKVAL